MRDEVQVPRPGPVPGPQGHDSEEPLDAALAALPTADLDAGSAASARQRAQRVLARERALSDRPLARTWDRVWARRVEPALLAGSSAYYLVWVLATLSAVSR